MENEIWKQTFIDGISVSSLGRVKRDRDGYIIKPRTNKTNGYNYVDLRCYKNGKQPTAYGFQWKYKYDKN